MKTVYKIFNLILVLTLFLKAQYKCKISIETEKNTYVKGELIQLGVSVLNVGSNTIEERIESTPTIKLINENGEELKQWGGQIKYSLPSAYLLKPNEEKYTVIELNQYFGKIYSIADAGQHYFETGNYTLIISLNPSYITAESTQISFRVIEPSGEDKDVYDKYVEFVKGFGNRKYTDQQTMERIKLLHETYPSSKYNPIFLEILVAYYDITTFDHEKASQTRKELVEKFPSSLRSWNIVNNNLIKTLSKVENIEYLKKIQMNNKSPLIKKLIEQKLKTEE